MSCLPLHQCPALRYCGSITRSSVCVLLTAYGLSAYPTWCFPVNHVLPLLHPVKLCVVCHVLRLAFAAPVGTQVFLEVLLFHVLLMFSMDGVMGLVYLSHMAFIVLPCRLLGLAGLALASSSECGFLWVVRRHRVVSQQNQLGQFVSCAEAQ